MSAIPLRGSPPPEDLSPTLKAYHSAFVCLKKTSTLPSPTARAYRYDRARECSIVGSGRARSSA